MDPIWLGHGLVAGTRHAPNLFLIVTRLRTTARSSIAERSRAGRHDCRLAERKPTRRIDTKPSLNHIPKLLHPWMRMDYFLTISISAGKSSGVDNY